MEDDRLVSNIQSLLSSPQRSLTTQEFLRAFGPGYSRKDISRCLYDLQSKGLVTKINESPPTWALNSPAKPRSAMGRGLSNRAHGRLLLGSNGGTKPYQSSRPVQTDGRPPLKGHSPGGGGERKSQIMEALLHSDKPKTATEIAGEVGLRGAAAVNSDISSLEKEGVLRRVVQSRGPVLWQLSTRPVENLPKNAVKIQRHGRTPPRTTPPVTTPTRFMLSHGATISNEPTLSSDVGNGGDSRAKILRYLSTTSEPQKAYTIGTEVGLSRHDVNCVLYQMEKELLVSSVKGSGPPLWTLKGDSDTKPVIKTGSELVVSPPLSVGRGSGVLTKILERCKSSPGGLTSSVQKSDDSLKECILETLSLSGTQDMSVEQITVCVSSKLKCVQQDILQCLQELKDEGQVISVDGKLWSRQEQEQEQEITSLPPLVEDHQPPSTNQIEETETFFLDNNPFNSALLNDLTRNPISVLCEYCQANKLQLKFPIVNEYGPPHNKTFVVAARYGSHQVEAKSTNKKDAKRMAADLALQQIRLTQVVRVEKSVEDSPSCSEASSTLHDHVASLAHGLHVKLESAADIPQPGRKVIACFIMEDEETGQVDVVSFGSGTRCITGDKISLGGDVVNDSHAEVVARRGLLRFLYQELKVYHGEQKEEVETIFEAPPELDGLVRVKETVKFHLFISTAPCGDGAQFSRTDSKNRDPPPGHTHLPTMSGRQQGILRTKMEGGEGTIPIGDAPKQTWDGILQGGRLRTMSCSDKIGRWNILGLQGALLSLFMAPVYLHSLTLGSLHHHGHLSRAVCCRFAGLDLPRPFRVNHLLLGRTQGGDEMKRHTEKTSNYCMNWSINDPKPEIIDGTTGSPISSARPSQVSKVSLFSQFISLSKLVDSKFLEDVQTYSDAKELAKDYQYAKMLLYSYCEDKGFGTWIRKPKEQNQFGLDDILS